MLLKKRLYNCIVIGVMVVLQGCDELPMATLPECPSDEALKAQMLAQINLARAESRYCGETYFGAVAGVVWNEKLASAAQAHSDDMARNRFFDHTGSNGSSVGERLSAAGYDWSTYNENIYAGIDTVQEAVRGWLKSPGHCKNIMSANIKEIGAACADTTKGDYGTYWTLDGGREE